MLLYIYFLCFGCSFFCFFIFSLSHQHKIILYLQWHRHTHLFYNQHANFIGFLFSDVCNLKRLLAFMKCCDSSNLWKMKMKIICKYYCLQQLASVMLPSPSPLPPPHKNSVFPWKNLLSTSKQQLFRYKYKTFLSNLLYLDRVLSSSYSTSRQLYWEFIELYLLFRSRRLPNVSVINTTHIHK